MYETIRCAARAHVRPDTVVCFLFDDCRLQRDDRSLDKAAGKALSAATKRCECTGEKGETTVIYTADHSRFVLVGLGSAAKFDCDVVRAVGGSLIATLHRLGCTTVLVRASSGLTKKVGADCFGRALGEGLGLGGFRFDEFKGTAAAKASGAKKNAKVSRLSVHATETAVNKAINTGLKLAESANLARRLAATPPNVATTMYIADEAKRVARASKGSIKCTIIKGQALEQNGLEGLINVGKASENPPCLIQLTYRPKGKSTGTVLLVGKTICYDTGGLSLKINNSMKGMKYDKNGGMAVLGAMHAVSWLKPKCKVVALLPAAENSISDEAYRPDDIITFLNGVTVEVTNTDAEGRLVLADALAFGCKKIKPDAIIDLATLTGGVVVALGSVCAGLWCEDDKLRKKIQAASAASGERVWRLPLHDEYREMMKAKHADIWNSAPIRHAHPIQGAAFLSYFVEKQIPWAHIDIAGTSAIDKDRAPFTAGPTGFGVRLLAQLLESW